MKITIYAPEVEAQMRNFYTLLPRYPLDDVRTGGSIQKLAANVPGYWLTGKCRAVAGLRHPELVLLLVWED
ncbi:hypothetical protein [Nitrosomonas communis]|uniref:hypothetical protein n=1 Tax=Nitrosomonas communis TaxID=44574 RepID=UPI003D2C9903